MADNINVFVKSLGRIDAGIETVGLKLGYGIVLNVRERKMLLDRLEGCLCNIAGCLTTVRNMAKDNRPEKDKD